MPQVLLAPQVTLGRLLRCVAEQELNLLQFSSIAMAELGTRPPHIVRSDMVQACLLTATLYVVPDHVLRDASVPLLADKFVKHRNRWQIYRQSRDLSKGESDEICQRRE
jgi:hypothetical protein